MTAIGSIPLMSFFAVLNLKTDILRSIWIALLRILKIFRFREVGKIFTNYLRAEKEKSKGYSNILLALYAILLATHMIGCSWLIVGRIDPEEDNWHEMDNFDQNPSHFEQYIEGCFYTVSTMTGMGFGNVVPTTILEYIAA